MAWLFVLGAAQLRPKKQSCVQGNSLKSFRQGQLWGFLRNLIYKDPNGKKNRYFRKKSRVGRFRQVGSGCWKPRIFFRPQLLLDQYYNNSSYYQMSHLLQTKTLCTDFIISYCYFIRQSATTTVIKLIPFCCSPVTYQIYMYATFSYSNCVKVLSTEENSFTEVKNKMFCLQQITR